MKNHHLNALQPIIILKYTLFTFVNCMHLIYVMVYVYLRCAIFNKALVFVFLSDYFLLRDYFNDISWFNDIYLYEFFLWIKLLSMYF